MNIANRLRELSDEKYKTDHALATQLAVLSSEAAGLETEIDRVNTEMERQAFKAVEKLAKLITEVTNLKEALAPFAGAHVAGSPYHAITLHDLRKAYSVLNPLLCSD